MKLLFIVPLRYSSSKALVHSRLHLLTAIINMYTIFLDDVNVVNITNAFLDWR